VGQILSNAALRVDSTRHLASHHICCMRPFAGPLHLIDEMNPGVKLLANKSFCFSLYDFHLEGVSVAELATAYSLPETWVEEHIEAVRLCLKYQVMVSVKPESKHAVI